MDEMMTQIPAAEETPKKRWKKPASGKKRRWPKVLLALVLAAVVAAWVILPRLGGGGTQMAAGYLVETVQRRDLTTTVKGTATLEPADAYQVTTLLSGSILTAPFEEDQLVEKGAVLYTLDSSDAQDSISRAGISVEQAQLTCQEVQAAMRPTAPISGTISEVYVHNGDTVTAGTPLAKIVASTDLSIDFLFTYVSPDQFYVGQSATIFVGNLDGSVQGTVTSVSDATTVTSNGKQTCTVRVKVSNPGSLSDAYTASAVIGSYCSYGDSPVSMPAAAVVTAGGSGTVTEFGKLTGSTVTKGEAICSIDSQELQSRLQEAQLTLESARLTASSAAGSLEDYTITAPISGTVIEKTFKAGDKVDGVSSGTLAVIYDLSSLTMKMNINELDIGKIRTGQTVTVTADALPGQTFAGVVEKVSVNGTTTNGFTTYPVTVSIQDYGDLKPGMNVSAEILCGTAEQVLCVPVAAVSRGNTVLVPGEGALAEDGSAVTDPTKLEERPVVLGRSDADYIEITSGLGQGDTVVYLDAAAGGAEMGG